MAAAILVDEARAAERPHMTADRERVALACFVGSAVLVGGSAVAVRFSNRELAPLWGAGLRLTLAAALLLAVMAVLRQPLPRGRALTGALLYGVCNFGAGFALLYYGLVRVHAGPVGASVPPRSLVALVGGAVCFAQAAVVVRRFPRVHPVTMNAVGMTTGAALLVAGSLLAGEPLVLPRHAATWAALGYLVAVGSVVAFVLYLVVLRYWAASRAAYMFVLIPFVTVAPSAWLDHEPVGAWLVLGGLLVLAGVYVGALRPARLPSPAGSPAAGRGRP